MGGDMGSSDASTASRWSPASGAERVRAWSHEVLRRRAPRRVAFVAAIAALSLACVSPRSAPEGRAQATTAPSASVRSSGPIAAPADHAAEAGAEARLPFYSTADFTAEWLD